MSFNDILVETGGFGVYQKLLIFGCLGFSLFVVSVTYWTQVFILLIPPHRCKTFSNDTEWVTVFNESNAQIEDRCHIVQENGTLTVCSHEIIYDFSSNFPTFTSEHDMVCEDSWKVYLSHTLYYIGTIFGTIVYGIINDKYGRRRAYQCAVTLMLVAEITTYFCHNQILFLIVRFFAAAGDGSLATIAFVLSIEHCIPSKRRLSIFVWSFSYALSSLAMVWLSYLTYNWRYILMFTWIPSTVAIVMSYFLPESPSWLITNGRIDEAVVYIQRMAKINGKNISRDRILHHLQINTENRKMDCNNAKTVSQSTEEKDLEKKEQTLSIYKTVLKVLKSRNLRKRILCLGFLWMASCACYNGNNLEFHYLPFNMYITYSIGALVEIPGNLLVVLILDKWGRRWTNAGFFIVGGIFGILSANVASKSMILILVMIMRTCYSSAYDITFSFSSEIIPTEIRGRVISFIRTCGGLGSATAPFVVSLAQEDPLLPLALFGILSIIAGLAMLTLPETTHKHLPQTIEDGENFETDQSFWLCPCYGDHADERSEDMKESSLFGTLSNLAVEKDEEHVKCVRIQKLPKY